jgi:hypothetical protein
VLQRIGVGQQRPTDGFAHAALQRPQRFLVGLAFGELGVEVDTPIATL